MATPVDYAAIAAKLGGTSTPAKGQQGPPTPPADPWYRASPQTPARQAGSLDDTIRNVGSHLANMVTGPFKAAFAPPADPTEAGISAAATSTVGNAAVPAALGAYRAFVKPSQQAVQSLIEQAKKGNYFSKDEYDAQGNYQPSMVSSAVDAIPIAGPWARNIETEAQQKGAVPALAGLGTDLLAPKVGGKALGVAGKTVGKAAQLASTTRPAASLYATRSLVPGTAGELLQSALKPGVKYGAGVGGMLEQALPDVVAADPALRGVSGFTRAADLAKEAARQPYNDLLAPYRPPQALIRGKLQPAIGPVNPGEIPGHPIAEAQMASIPELRRFESPKAVGPPSDWTATNPNTTTGIIQRTAEKAANYDRPLPVAKADVLREGANQELHAFYNKAGGDQYGALADPETARVKAIGDTIREQLYPQLESDAGLQPGTVAGMQEKFGRLSEVSDIGNRREPVFARHDPVSLSQQIVMGHGGPIARATNFAVGRLFRGVTDSDALVNSAIDRLQNKQGTPLPPRAGLFPQMGSTIGKTLYGGGQLAGRMPMKYNPFAMYAATNPPKR